MRSVQVTALDGPAGVSVQDVPDATAQDGQVLVEVKALGISWPDLLQTKGEYQIKPELPFQLGVDFAGVVRSAPEDSGLAEGQRVACCLPYGGGADLVSIHPESVFAAARPLQLRAGCGDPDELPDRRVRARAPAAGWPRATRCWSPARPAASAPRPSRSARGSAPA